MIFSLMGDRRYWSNRWILPLKFLLIGDVDYPVADVE